jgi:hypothetical protein
VGVSSGVALGSSELLELELLELELLESSPGSLGGGCVGKGWSAAAEDGVVAGAGASGEAEVFAGLAGAPGNGNCSAAEGFFVLAGGGAQGWVAVLSVV